MSADGVYPPPRLQPIEITYFGETITFIYPPLASFAILSYFARAETRPFCVPPHLPQSRADATALGLQGPTRDDVIHFNENCKTLFPQGDAWTALEGRRHDPDWFRAARYPHPTGLSSRQGLHPPGTFTGQWLGSIFVRRLVLR